MNVTVTKVSTVSGIAGSFIGEPTAEVVLRVEGNAASVEAVREYVERACALLAQQERS